MKSYELDIPVLNSDRFLIYKEGKETHMCAEASDFDGAFKPHRLYNDACDIGIAIKSGRTGVVERFTLTRTETRDDELLAWCFAPVNPKCGVHEVTIFND